MLELTEWTRLIKQKEAELGEINLQVAYRKLRVLGPNYNEDYLVRGGGEENKLNSDKEYNELRFKKNRLETEIFYIKSTGEAPPSLMGG